MRTARRDAQYLTGWLGVATLLLFLMSCGDTKPKINGKSNGKKATSAALQQPNLLLITVDTTRADHLGCYGYSDIKTPNMDGLARDGVLFEEAFSVQPVTLPAHCSIHTGKYPFRHGVRDNSIYQLGQEHETLAEVLKDAGYLTTAFVASYILNSRFGLDQGFYFYNDRFVKPKQKGRLPVDRRASEVSFLASEWMREVGASLKRKPFFLWLHYYDPHADYHPPHPYNTAYGNPYDGEIAYMDDWLGYFFDELKKKDKWENTMVVLVGDHGEGFGEHGENTHGMFIYRSTTHVPLIIKFPHNRFAGKRIGAKVSQVDILPTVLEVLGQKSRDGIDGKTLMPLLDGSELWDRDVYSETYIPRSFHWSALKGLRSEKRFFVDAPVPELYRTDVDVNETRNVYDTDSKVAQQMSLELNAMVKKVPAAKSNEVVLSDEMTARLEALGYFVTSGATENLDEIELPDPKDRIEVFNAQQRANNLFDSGRWTEALNQYEKLVKEDPENPRLLLDLARVLEKLSEYKRAEKVFVDAAKLDSKNARLFSLMGVMYKNWGKNDNAVSAFEKAIALNSRDAISMFHISLIAMSQNEFDTATAWLRRALKILPMPAAYNNLGYIYIKHYNRFAEGVKYLKKAVSLATDKAPFLHSLGMAYLDHSRIKEAVPLLQQAVQLVPENMGFAKSLIRAYQSSGDAEKANALQKRLDVLQKRSGS
ncbi:MAG: sulfatase-like hydrolase/transferase [Deltaproteobacteria bacterium]|nr:sulfatase-like hydrolase/transferase [Deltaproteobacteria bacterium]